MADYPLIDIDLSGKKEKPKGKRKISFKLPTRTKKGKRPKPRIKIEAPKITKETMATIIMVLLIVAPVLWLGWQYSALNNQEREERNLLAQRKREYQRLKPIEKKLKLLNKKKEALTTKVNTIKSLSADRNEVPAVLDELEKIVPDGISIDRFDFTPGRSLSLHGYALSDMEIARFIDALEQSPHYGEYSLGPVKTVKLSAPKILAGKKGEKSTITMKEFTLSVKSTPPKVELPTKRRKR